MDTDNSNSENVTELLERLQDSPETLDQIMSMVYEDLHRVARNQRRSFGMSSPQTTVLVHDAFIKLFGPSGPEIKDTQHLKRMVAKAVRHLIVDQARSQLAQKRGGGAWHTAFESDQHQARTEAAEHVLIVEQALLRLEQLEPELADLIVGTYYGGYTARELADITGRSPRTIERQLERARGWLRFELNR